MIEKSMNRFFYLINIQFLGFRFSGWQKQKNAKTIQMMVDKTLSFILGHSEFKTLGAGRTDAKVSANQFALELFVNQKIEMDFLLKELNRNFPADMRCLSTKEVDEKFNIINDPKIKEYLYLFTHGEKIHPFCAPFMVSFPGPLDLKLMAEGASQFIGKHNWKDFCYRPNDKTQFIRSVQYCKIVENLEFCANFFPEKSWILHVHGKGFMRHQIRMMMGALICLGSGEITLDDIKKSLKGDETILRARGLMAPSSALLLNKVHFE